MILRVKSPEPSGSIAWEPSRNAHSWAPPGPDEPLPAGRGPEIRAGTGDSSTRSGLRPTAPPRCWEPDHPRKSSGRATRKELRQPMDGLVTIKVPPAAPCSGLTVPPGSCGVQTAFLPSAHWRRKGPSARFAAPVLPRTFRGSRELHAVGGGVQAPQTPRPACTAGPAAPSASPRAGGGSAGWRGDRAAGTWPRWKLRGGPTRYPGSSPRGAGAAGAAEEGRPHMNGDLVPKTSLEPEPQHRGFSRATSPQRRH